MTDESDKWRYLRYASLVHLPKIWILLFETPAEAAAEAPLIRKECVLILGTSGKQNVRSPTMSFHVRKQCGVRTKKGPPGAGWLEI